MIRYYFLYLLLFFTNAIFAQSANLSIQVEGLNSAKGNIVIGLYNKAEGFGKGDYAIDGATVTVTGTTVTYTFKDLPSTNYALAIFHDANSDQKLNTNLVGYPKENYGFSNNTFGAFGTIPDFEKAKINVGEGETKEIKIKLR